MSAKTFFITILALFVCPLILSCRAGEIKGNPPNSGQNSIVNVSDTNKNALSKKNDDIDVKELCNKLNELKRIPYDTDQTADDPIYDGLKSKGNAAIPCLIEKITDETPMTDPREAPTVSDFKVGDAAVFMLLIVSKQDWQPSTMFPPQYAKLWDSDGIYVYFSYVEKKANRKKNQIWWKKWAEDRENKNPV